MSLRDCELDVALLLQAAGLGSLADGSPTLFAGPYPGSAPDALVACRHAGADKPEKYLAATGLRLHRETVTVLVRGARGPGGYVESGTRARAAWAALYDLHPDEYVTVDPEDGGPNYLGTDAEQRPQWSFPVSLEYVSATAPGVVVPLSREATLRVGGLEVTGGARVAGALVIGALPLSAFPSPVGQSGALLFDTAAGLLHVSDGADWREVGAPPPPPTAGEVAVTPAGGLAASNVQEALEELQEDVSGRATEAELAELETQVAGKADASAVAAALVLKADASALAAHTAATVAHGVTGALVGTTDVQTLSGKKHAGLFEVVDVASGVVALRIPTGSRLSLTADGLRYFYWDTIFMRSSSAFAAPVVNVGAGIGLENGAFGTDAGSFVLNRNGRVKRLGSDTTATPGSVTANTWRGRAKVAAGQASITITNNLCLATTDLRAWVQQASPDATGAFVSRTSTAAGALTIHLNTAPAADLVVAWELID